jgi:hypothetical protein
MTRDHFRPVLEAIRGALAEHDYDVFDLHGDSVNYYFAGDGQGTWGVTVCFTVVPRPLPVPKPTYDYLTQRARFNYRNRDIFARSPRFYPSGYIEFLAEDEHEG